MTNIVSLVDHIKKLKERESNSSIKADDAILFWGTSFDKVYLPHLKACVGSTTTFIRVDSITTLIEVQMYCDKKKINRVVSSSVDLLKKLLNWDKRAAPSLAAYTGSWFEIASLDKEGEKIEIVFIPPLKNLVTVPSGVFIAKRVISKLINKDKWYKPSPFRWELLDAGNENDQFNRFSHEECFLISIDIETLREGTNIRCISYTAFWYSPLQETGINSYTVVLPIDSDYQLAIMRKWNWELKAPKVFQNGKYDIAYLSRFSAPVYNYLYDTAHLFHCIYSELPKDLGFLNSFYIREAVYWKDLAQTNDLHEYYRYNALDTWGTGNVFLAMLLEAPKYAIKNYLLEFPLIFPCHLSEMTGIKRDMSRLEEARAEVDEIIKKKSKILDTILSVPEGETFNVKSPKQMKQLLEILGCVDLKSADEKNLKKARFRHPLNARIINLVLGIRTARTLKEKYLQIGEKSKEFGPEGKERILYALNPHGTDTSRLASREHHFWCGLQIQNIPRGKEVKCTLMADDGFLLCEVDYSQAESRDTAYISGDENLIESVEHSPDFHSANASKFFGIPFEEIYDIATGKVLLKPIRQLSKNVNHGANYNMGAYILVETMGEENIAKARTALGLNRFWSHIQVAEYLLEQFHKTYPGIKGVFYEGVKNEIRGSRKLSSKAVFGFDYKNIVNYKEALEKEGAWTRYCFGNPDKNKMHLNAYIAHPPQSLNAQTLNKAYLRVFHEIAMNPKHSKDFKLICQVHDSILFQHRIGHEYLKDMVKDCMIIPITIRAYDKKIRTFTVPVDVSNSGKYWSDLK